MRINQDTMTNRDFSTISSTARSLLLMKGIATSIPYLKEAAVLVVGHGAIDFECRYLSIDRAVADSPVENFLEIASGFSFRSLDMTRERKCFYLDTDLPEVIETKASMAAELMRAEDRSAERSPHFLALNALDTDQFSSALSLFPPGPITVMNEGLLIYLDDAEKRRLCEIVRKALMDRGGSWVSGDIYVRKGSAAKARLLGPEARKFLAEHKVIENQFADFDAAAEFFTQCGFRFEAHTADEVYEHLSSVNTLKRYQEVDEDEIRARLQTRQTWVLSAV